MTITDLFIPLYLVHYLVVHQVVNFEIRCKGTAFLRHMQAKTEKSPEVEGTEKLFLRNCTFCKQKLAYVQFFLYLCSVIRKRHA